jgi:hypothetical protein
VTAGMGRLTEDLASRDALCSSAVNENVGKIDAETLRYALSRLATTSGCMKSNPANWVISIPL